MAEGKPNNRNNPRSRNGYLRRKHRARFKALGLPCAICGRPINYDEPSDAQHPWSFVIDEIIPVSKYWLGGYPNREACAQDWNNLQAVHYCCNASKGAKLNYSLKSTIGQTLVNKIDGDW